MWGRRRASKPTLIVSSFSANHLTKHFGPNILAAQNLYEGSERRNSSTSHENVPNLFSDAKSWTSHLAPLALVAVLLPSNPERTIFVELSKKRVSSTSFETVTRVTAH